MKRETCPAHRLGDIDLVRLASEYDESNVPLYVSYPVTSFWKGAWDDDAFVRAYDRTRTPFLYFHFPYCRKACFYCCCYKEVTQSGEVKEEYLRSLQSEFDLRLDTLGIKRLTGVRHMHWGGGTPTYWSTDQLRRMCETVEQRVDFDFDCETTVSIEAYPDEEILSPEKLRVLRDGGFNEISFGVQDFDERIQKTINRNNAPAALARLVGLAKNLGFRINIDLCYGLPYQGVAEFERTLHQVIDIEPDKVAVFPYAHYPFVFPLQRRIPSESVPGSFARVCLMRCAEEIFDASGYERIGIDHFVKPDNPIATAYRKGNAIKDFMGYSVEGRRSFIGFGSSAISCVGDTFFQNTASIADYRLQVGQGCLPSLNGAMHALTPDDVLRHRLIQKQILCDFVIDPGALEFEFEISFDDYFAPELERLAELTRDGLVEPVGHGSYEVTAAGRCFARHIAYAFDPYYRMHS